MNTVYKYQLDPHTDILKLPEGAKVLSVEEQNEKIVLYALVNTEAALVERSFPVFGTGHEIPSTSGLKFIGTVKLLRGALMLHVFEDILFGDF